jgi:ATP-dependent helicase Lhr and Lhr-like helicase
VTVAAPAPLADFDPRVRAWFQAAFDAPTPAQALAWPAIARGEHVLLCAPTGSGKTLAAFLWALDRRVRREEGVGGRGDGAQDGAGGDARGREGRGGANGRRARAEGEGALGEGGRAEGGVRDGVSVLYVSPLKALAYDIERNLRAPLRGIGAQDVKVGIRTGDTPQRERAAMLRKPPDILITTPESLYLMLTSQAAAILAGVEAVIVDEIHAVAGSKRGAHLALTLERLDALVAVRARAHGRGPQRIGLSATQRPLSEIGRFLGGPGREVTILDATAPAKLDLTIEVPVESMSDPEASGPADPLAPLAGGEATTGSIWPAIYPELLKHVRGQTSTIVFVNNRRAAERVALRLNELAGEEIALAHHGSLAREERTRVEELLKAGSLPCIVATSSLELGIDMGAVDLVLQVESPKSVARGLQRVGRAGHSVGEVSKGLFFPKFRGDLLECAVVCKQMRKGAIEPTSIPRNPLDVLAQQIVAIAVAAERDGEVGVDVDGLYGLVTRTYTYSELSRELFERVLDMLDGRWAGVPRWAGGPSSGFGDRSTIGLKAYIVWDRLAGVIRPRRGARQLAIANAGTIPDRGLYTVVLPDGRRVGELDEEMVYEARTGQTFMLGASTWRIEEIGRDRVIVTPAPGAPGAVPFWKGETLGRPFELGREIGAFARWAVDQKPETLSGDYDLDERAANNLVEYLREQRDATRVLPSDRTIVLERFRDEIGDWRLCLLSPFGARVHAAWGLALSARVRDHYGLEPDALWSDDGIVLRLPELDADQEASLPSAAELVKIDPDELREIVTAELGSSALFGARFREAAARALLIPRAYPGRRTPLWQQRLKAQNLLEVAREHPDFPIVLETYRECLQDVLDLPGLEGLLRAMQSREVELVEVETPTASPFASSLLFDYLATYMYEGDAPTAERRAAALSLDKDLLRELLGSEELRELIDPGALERLLADLQRRSAIRQATSRDELHDVLRELGDLTAAEIGERVLPDLDSEALLAGLRRERRAIELRLGGESRYVAAEDAGLYRDALGAMPPGGLPATFLADVQDALTQLVARYARTHGPFAAADLRARYGVDAGAALRERQRSGALVRGEIAPGGSAVDWCDADVLRRLRRASLAVLRKEVEPAAQSALARFLPAWQNVDRHPASGAGPERLREALVPLQGLALPVEVWERDVLPRRLGAYSPAWLDGLCASGELVWVGAGPGRAALYFREDAPLLGPPQPPRGSGPAPSGPAHELLRARLCQAPSFFGDLLAAAAGAELSSEAARSAEVEPSFEAARSAEVDLSFEAARSAEVEPSSEAARSAEVDLSFEALRAALFELVWAGEVTNDAWAPLRWPTSDRSPVRLTALSAPGASALAGGSATTAGFAPAGRPAPGGARFAPRRRSLARARGRAHPPGRWSLTAPVFAGALSAGAAGPDGVGAGGAGVGGAGAGGVPPRERRRAQAELLLERYGVLTREQVLAERVEGGFAGLYSTLCDLETLGVCRRGYFVEGLGGAQFALPGAVERLRSERDARPGALVLAACDPAQPYGAALPWPSPARARGRRPARAAGAYTVLVAGAPVLYLERGLRSLAVLAPAAEPASGQRAGEAVFAALRELAAAVRAGRLARLALERIDGEPAVGSHWEEALRELGFRASPRRLELSA